MNAHKSNLLNTLVQYFWAYYRKFSKKLFGVVHLYTKKPKKGSLLLSFITGPFTLAPNQRFTDPHTNYWTCEEIARLFLERGYDIDVIEWNNNTFIPKKKYAICIDLNQNLERLNHFLEPTCTKIMFIVGSHPEFQNAAEKARIQSLEKRRGVLLKTRREVPLLRNLACADFIIGYGNKTVHDTFGQFGKKIISIHVATKDTYDFPTDKDFSTTSKNFLWFGGGGAILKGLDLIVEAFAELPQFNLTIIGPSAFEKEFENVYSKELALPNIRRYPRPRITDTGGVEVNGRDLLEYMNECAATIFMSASEGAGASVVQTMQAGLVPIVTPNSGIDERAGGVIISDPTVEKIKKAVIDFANLPPKKIKEMAHQAWSFAREHHTKEAFTKAYSDFIDNTLKLNK